MARKVLTVRELESVGQGGELVVAFGTIVTPLARDEAEARGITIRFEAQKASDPESANAAPTRAIAIGADHGGFDLKEELKGYLHAWGYTVLDQGTMSRDAVDYPDFAESVANAVVRGDAARGIVIDSAGIG